MKRNVLAASLAVFLALAALFSTVVIVTAGRQETPVDLAAAFEIMRLTPTSAAAPDFTLASLEASSTISIDDFRGQVVFLNFWATWCAPCVAEMPAMQTLYERYRDDGLVVLAVNVREDEATVQEFIDRLGVTYPIALDRAGEVTNLYNVRGFPTTMIIDRGGNVIGVKLGYHDWDEEATMNAFGEIMRMGSR